MASEALASTPEPDTPTGADDAKATASGAGLPQLTGFLLRRAYVKAAASAAACVGEDAHVRDVGLLAILDERGPLSQRHLSDMTRINPTIMVKVVDRLEQRGWVVRERNPADRRSYAVRLTAEGSRAFSALSDELHIGERILTETLTTGQRDQLKRALLKLLGGRPDPGIGSLSDHTGYLISLGHRLVRGWAIEALAPLDLDPRDFGVLSTIGRDQPCSQNHLAQALGVTPPAALAFVEELASAGLVRRERNVGDRRSYDLTLTELGAERLAAARKAAADVQTRVVDRLGEKADQRLRRLLTKVVYDA
ncbi:MAG TPA: MarR family transcriptional regulator [Nocardioidaceae bacterium]|jgi:DNA-binding MarR family transcriptional regulator